MPRPLKRYKPRVKKYDHGGAHPKKSETDIPLSQASGGFQLYRQFRDDGTSFITPTPYNSNYVKISDRGYYGTEDEGISPIMLGEAEVVADDLNRDPMDSIDKVVKRTGAGVYGDMYRTTTPEKRLEHLMGVLNSQDEFARYGIQAAGFAPGAGEAIDMINIPWAAATGTDIYTGRPMGTTEATAWGVGGLVLPNILQKPMQWLIRKGAKNADDIKRLISPYIRNIKDAPADLKPLLELSKKSDGMKTYLSKYEADPNVFGGGPIQGRRPGDALVDYLAETNPELLLKFSPENASKGMFDEFTQGWVRNYNKGFRGGRGIYKDTPGRFGVTPGFSPEDMLLKPSGHVGDISGKSLGMGKYFTDDIGTASDYASIYKNWMDPNAWSKVGAVQMFPEIGRQGQSMGDILKHININETIGQTTLGLRSPGFGMQTRATGRFPERVLRSGPASEAQILDIFDVGRFGMSSSDLAKYSPDFGGVGSIVTPDFTKVNPFTLSPTKPRGTEGIIESLIPTKEKGGKVKAIKKRKMRVKKYHNGGKGPGHPHLAYQDSLDVYNNQEELNRLSEAYNAHIEKHTKASFDSSTGGMQRSYHSNREAMEAGKILLADFQNKKFELFKEFHKKFPDLDNPYVLEQGNPDFYDSDADIALGKQTWGTNKYKTVKPIEEKEAVKKTLVKKEKPPTASSMSSDDLREYVGEKAWEKIQEAIRKYPMDFDHNAENIEMYAYLNDPDDVDYDPERYIEKTTPKMGRSLDILNTFVPEGNNDVYGEDIMTRVANELKFAPYVYSLPMETLPMESLPIDYELPEPTIRTSQATPKVNTGKWSKPILEYSPSGGQGWQTGTYQYETGKGPKIRKDEPEEIAWNKYEALKGTRWEIPKPGYAKGGKVKAIKKRKMRTLKNGGTPQGDPPPEGYKYNESGSLEPIGWSEFHEEGNIDMDELMRGVSAVESGGGQDIFMKNPGTDATGQYGQMYYQIKDMDFMKGISRDDFAKDRDLQNRVFNMRYMGELTDIPGLEDNAYDLTKDYAEDLGDKWEYTLDEVAALSNFIGRKGTRKFFEALGRGETYTPPGVNKTVEQYLKEYREGRDNYEKGGKFKLKKKMRLLKMMFGGGRLPYNDYGMDDSIGMSYQNSSDQFMDMNSTLTGGIPQDSVQAQDPQFEVPVFQSKKEMRKEKRKGVRTVRQAARDARKQARNPERYARRQQMKLIKDDRKTGKFDAKSIKDWKDYS